MDNNEKLQAIIRHVKRVEDNCNRLAMQLAKEDFDFALHLVQLGRMHDVSKFSAGEFRDLDKDSPNFKEALKHHRYNNPHHPEYWWDGIHQMPDIYLAEMVCDCVARAQEFGTDARQWFNEVATKKYDFTMEDDCGIKITKYLDLLLPKTF